MIRYPNAKINLGLQVGNKRPDGYHDIYSWFVPLPLFDALEAVVAEDSDVSVEWHQTGIPVPGDTSGNLVMRAIDLLRRHHELPGLKVHLHKQIPMGAGLGGGSADASGMLMLLNDLLQLNISTEQLASLALELGSDCPFFIYNQTMQVSGRGELMHPVSLQLKGYTYILIDSGIHIGTAEAYQNIIRSGKQLPSVIPGNISYWKEQLFNDFEGYAFQKHPELQLYKNMLYESGAFYASMTGSGSALYGLYEEPPSPETFRAMRVFSGVF